MSLFRSVSVFLVLIAAVAGAQTAPAPEAATKATRIPGFSPELMDKSVEPCVDFYQYACGTWIKNNPVPADRARWGRFDALAESNEAVLRGILENAARPDPKRGAIEQKIGDYYASCMDEKAVEAKGTKPIQPHLKRIAAIRDRAAVITEVARLHQEGVSALFAFRPQQDFHDSEMMVANLDQGGLGLPDRDYYLKDDVKSLAIRKEYMGHVRKMLELLGDKPAAAASTAERIMDLETELAKASMDRTARRDPRNRDHKMKREELLALAPGFDFPRYFTAAGVPSFAELNVAAPAFFKQVNAMLERLPLEDWKAYLRWRVVGAGASLLPDAFVKENFRFYGQVLSGQKELRPRWKRCVELTDDHLGEALGQPYVDLTFGVEGKQRMLKMVAALEKALERDIRELPWMTAATKQRALEKLHAIRNKIGYPEKWRDYSSVRIVRGDALGNASRANTFETNRQLAKIGKPVDRLEWLMTPPTVNAYYSGGRNEIVFPAGILQPPFFDKEMDDAVNFGGIGAVIGHELTHGFDDQGRKFDAKGNLTDWWTAEDGKAFEERARCIDEQYSQYAVGEMKLNGKLTLGENTADNGGLRIALMALLDTPGEKSATPIDGFAPEQRIFLGWGQIWCQNVRPEEARRRVITDPHSPGEYRVNGVVSNMPEFQKAFGCKAGQPMLRENACRVW